MIRDMAREVARQLVTIRFFSAWGWHLCAQDAERIGASWTATECRRLSQDGLRAALSALSELRTEGTDG